MKSKIKYLFILSLILNNFSCFGSDYIDIKVTYYDYRTKTEHTEIIKEKRETKKIKFIVPAGIEIRKIIGVEQLESLTELFIGDRFIADLAFIKHLNKLKILLILGYENIDLSFLLKLPDLEIFYMNNIIVKNPYNFDFSNNHKLKYVTLNNISLDWPGRYYELSIENIPESLKYLDMSLSGFILLTKDLLTKLSSIPYVFLCNKEPRFFPYKGAITEVNTDYFNDKPNFIFKNPKTILPEELWWENLFALFDDK